MRRHRKPSHRPAPNVGYVQASRRVPSQTRRTRRIPPQPARPAGRRARPRRADADRRAGCTTRTGRTPRVQHTPSRSSRDALVVRRAGLSARLFRLADRATAVRTSGIAVRSARRVARGSGAREARTRSWRSGRTRWSRRSHFWPRKAVDAAHEAARHVYVFGLSAFRGTRRRRAVTGSAASHSPAAGGRSCPRRAGAAAEAAPTAQLWQSFGCRRRQASPQQYRHAESDEHSPALAQTMRSRASARRRPVAVGLPDRTRPTSGARAGGAVAETELHGRRPATGR